MVWVDYLIVVIILLSAAISLIRGFSREVFSLVSWIVAIWVALTFYAQLATLLLATIETASIRLFVAFATLFVVTLILGALVNHLLAKLVEKTGLTGTDRSLGVIFGLMRGVLLVALVVLLARLTPLPADPWWQNSLLIPQFESLADWLLQLLPSGVSEHFELTRG